MNDERLRTMWPATRFGRWMIRDGQDRLASVVIPTFNRSRFLLQALDSVRGQTYRPIEIVIVDDGSTDNTAKVLRAWAAFSIDDPEFVIRCLHQDNSGAPTARNRGLLDCTGEFVQFLDSDDILHPEKLQRQVDALTEHPEADYVYSGIAHFSDVVDWTLAPYCGSKPVPDDSVLLSFLRGGAWQTISGLYRRKACIAIGPWAENAPILQDWDYNVRFLLGDPRTVFLDGTLSLQRTGSADRITATAAGSRRSERSLRGMFALYAKWREMIAAAGRLDRDLERALADPMVELVKQALLNDHDDLARDIVLWLQGMSMSSDWSRRLAAYALFVRLPAPWCSYLARAYECVRVWTRPAREALHLVAK